MRSLSIRRAHRLGQAEARARVERAAAKLTERFGATCTWHGASLRIQHPGVRGTVAVGAEEIVVEAEFGLALGLLHGRVGAEIARILDRELAA
jgi:putative polyhydroxyalkanoate system protein